MSEVTSKMTRSDVEGDTDIDIWDNVGSKVQVRNQEEHLHKKD